MFLFQATVRAHPDHGDDLAAVLAPLAEASRSDPGCLEFRVSRDIEDPTIFRTFELWETVEDEAAHGQSPHELEARRLAREGGFAVAGEMSVYRVEPLKTATAGGGETE